MTIHHTDPFATPEGERSPVRRLRGRLPAAVTLWTTPGDRGPAGLTVSSTLIVDGEPGRIIGLVDEESDFWPAAQAAGVFAVVVLTPADQQLADRFAGLMPAPGGAFQGSRWQHTPYGPVPDEPRTWAGGRIADARRVGWSLLVDAEVEHVELTDAEPLIHHRGRYRSAQ